MAVLSVGNDGNFERFLTWGTSQTTKPCCCIITLRYALLQGYFYILLWTLAGDYFKFHPLEKNADIFGRDLGYYISVQTILLMCGVWRLYPRIFEYYSYPLRLNLRVISAVYTIYPSIAIIISFTVRNRKDYNAQVWSKGFKNHRGVCAKNESDYCKNHW